MVYEAKSLDDQKDYACKSISKAKLVTKVSAMISMLAWRLTSSALTAAVFLCLLRTRKIKVHIQLARLALLCNRRMWQTYRERLRFSTSFLIMPTLQS